MTTVPPAPSDERPDPQVVVGRGHPLRVDRSVVDDVAAHVSADTTVEHGGVLLGVVDPQGVLAITAMVRAEHAVSTASSLTFTHETWDHINDVRDRDFPELQIVGWYHSHPGFSVFLSEYDTFIHRNFFSAEWQVAYVVDPLLHDDGFFGWHGGQIVRYPEWAVRAVSGRRGAGVQAPDADRSRSQTHPVAPPARRWGALLGVGVGAALAGLMAGIALGGDPAAPAPVPSSTTIAGPPTSTSTTTPATSSTSAAATGAAPTAPTSTP
ncbi:MAG: Mov34/MPN/PAD-1 family protein [Actinomycetota bacterium]|nr:Mov34/MPN/PAD-1 family protein [Actinomycetota bacterium]